MKDLKKKIEEAAHRHGRKINTHVGDGNFIDGALSPEAKKYWQQGTYTEEEVFKLLFKFGNYMMISNEMDLTEWFEKNKKKL